MKVVTYTCECGTTTDSTKSLIGWAWGKGRVWCPECDAERSRRAGKASFQPESEPST